MNWTSYPNNRPAESGTYLASITRPYLENDTLTFSYVAFYNRDNDTWYKYDSFTSETQEEITDTINGWLANLPTYLG